jgi:PhnB protein
MATAIPLPAGVHTVTPSLVVRNAAGAIDFYKKVFGAEEISRLEKADGRVWHCELRVGDSVLFLSDELPGSSVRAPSPEAFASSAIRIYVPDADAVFRRALEAGGRSLRPVGDAFWGDRMGILADPFGHTWVISTHVKDVPADEVRRHGVELSRESALQMAGIVGA